MVLAVLSGGRGDAELAGVWNDIASQRLERSRHTANILVRKAGGRARLSRHDTALTLWTLIEPSLFTMFTSHGNTADHYETWLGNVLSRTLLD